MKMSGGNSVLKGLAALALAAGSLAAGGACWGQQQAADANSPAAVASNGAAGSSSPAAPSDSSAASAQSSSSAQTTASASASASAASPAAAPAQQAAPQSAQTPAAAPGAPQPLPMPSCSAPLATAVPHTFDAGPLGQLAITGILSGFGETQNNRTSSDTASLWDLSNGQIFIQKTTGWWQFYLQAGAYNIPDLGLPYATTPFYIQNLYGAFPQGYLKLVKGNFNVEIGALPTLIGAEYTFDFENMNIQRGILWNQENAVNRGVQLNEVYKKLTLALSLNDGFYSKKFTWLSGSAAYAFNAANTLSFVGMGNSSAETKNTFATPELQNDSRIFNVIYTYAKGPWMIMPYYQYTDVPANAKIGTLTGSSTNGGAVLANYNFKKGYSLAGRVEYITSSSGRFVGGAPVNLLYGPNSNAFSVTATPAWQKSAFFVRGELGFVKARSIAPGAAFGLAGTKDAQIRGVIESGFMF